MGKRFILLTKYFLFWFLYFILIKTLFIIFNFNLAKNLTFSELLGIYFYGLKLDISATTYLLLIPYLIFIFSIFFKSGLIRQICNWYTYIFIIVISFLTIGDLELYQYWGFRLDTTPLLYLNTPGEMIASVEWYVVVRQLFIFISLSVFFIWLYKKYIIPSINKISIGKFWELPIFLVVFGSLIIPIRGGFGLAPLNTGSAYFCDNDFANHSAINMFWNAGFSLTRYEGNTNT